MKYGKNMWYFFDGNDDEQTHTDDCKDLEVRKKNDIHGKSSDKNKTNNMDAFKIPNFLLEFQTPKFKLEDSLNSKLNVKLSSKTVYHLVHNKHQ